MSNKLENYTRKLTKWQEFPMIEKTRYVRKQIKRCG
jgi:hypothetical protein